MRLHRCFAVFGGLLASACCDDSIAVRNRSPYEAMEARAIVSNCGATTDFTTTLVFAYPEADPGRGGAFAVFNGRPPVTFQWQNKNELRVTLPACVASRTLKAERVHNRMLIAYAQVPPGSETCAPLPITE